MSNHYFLSNWTGGERLSTPTASNLARWFTPHIPMCGPEYNPEKMAVLADIPVQLQKAINDGMEPIDIDCVKQNAQFVFHFYEAICVEHVLEMQMENRYVRRLTQRDPHHTDSTERTLVPEGRLTRSSLIGRDICGDTDRPDPEGSDASDDDDADADTNAGASAQESTQRKKKKKKKYSNLQLLLIEVQDKTYLYLTVHIFRIISPFFQGLLKDKEQEYKDDKNSIRTKSARNRMPWKEYKEMILVRLQEGHGWHFLCNLVNLFRQNGEQRRSWLQRIEIGRQWSEKFKIKLPDQIYVGLALRHTMRGERVQIAKQFMLENVDTEAEVAEYKIQELTWPKLKQLSEVCMESPKSYRCDMRTMKKLQRMFFFEEAKSLFGMIDRRSKGATKGNLTIVCRLCKKAGLYGRLLNHKTENCDPRTRQKNVEKMKKRTAQRTQKITGQPAETKKRKRETSARAPQITCKLCASNGRKSWHDPKKCNYAPGGAWHGLKGEQLKEAQRKTYQNVKNANKVGKTSEGKFSKKNSAKPIKKMRASSLRTKDGLGKPYWLTQCHSAVQQPARLDEPGTNLMPTIGIPEQVIPNGMEETNMQYCTSQVDHPKWAPTPGVSFKKMDDQSEDEDPLVGPIRRHLDAPVTDLWVQRTLSMMPVTQEVNETVLVSDKKEGLVKMASTSSETEMTATVAEATSVENPKIVATDSSATNDDEYCTTRLGESAAVEAELPENDHGKDPLFGSSEGSETAEEYEVSEDTDLDEKVQKYLAEDPQQQEAKKPENDIIVISDSDSEEEKARHVCHMMNARVATAEETEASAPAEPAA